MAKMSSLEKNGTTEDIASVVSFLAGPDGGWINGQVLRANERRTGLFFFFFFLGVQKRAVPASHFKITAFISRG